MNHRYTRTFQVAVALLAVAPCLMYAQGGRGGGRGPAGPPPTGKSRAPFDLTGYWVSEIVDEWRFRVSPVKGDILYMPLNAEARRIAEAWDPDKDIADGNQCKAYGAIGLMQRPGRLHITWLDDNTLKVDADAGTQSRTWHFGPAMPNPGPPSLQGYSEAKWIGPGFGRGGRGFGERAPAGPPKTGGLEITTTNLLPGYLRKNGVPYSNKATMTEYVNFLQGQKGDTYITLTALVDDPVYLTGPFVRTYDFKKLPDASGWDPTPCWNK
ncbi:MAG TPA: hypothetical protein VHY84_25950 [Bryobacteraceae bacterium]|jgi:hypothetical protein|nr:hypothetical protein [Bryobacteraceae bacterium]